jgi:tRNA A37 N6-isopentenylltransferase MiaA
MQKEKFFGKFKHMNIDQTELNRKYYAYLREQELMMMYEAAMKSSSSAPPGIAGGGGAYMQSLFMEIAPDNDFYYTFSY